ncbi:MAG: glycosyltransferase family 4 protein [Nitrososphaeria archaeon]
MDVKKEKGDNSILFDSLRGHKKCVGIIHYSAPPTEKGGVERVIDAHIRFLAKRIEYTIHMIYGVGGGYKNDKILESKISVLSPQNQEVKTTQELILSERREVKSFISLKNKIKSRLNPILTDLDVCIVHNIPSMPFNLAATAAINELADELKTRFVFWIHDIALLRQEWIGKEKEFPANLFLHKSPNITYVTVTEYRARQLRELQLDNVQVIPNGVNIEDYLKIDKVTLELMHRLGIKFQDLIILVPVRVTPRKNIEMAIWVADELKHLLGSDQTLKVLVTGPPDHQATTMGMDYLEYLNKLIKRRGLEEEIIFCHDLISYDRVFVGNRVLKWSVGDVYSISDLVFVPSKEEGFGLPVIEAGAARKMVFCSRIPPFQELIKEDIDGFMFDLNGSPKDVAFRIYKEYILDIVGSNFNNVARRFTWDAILAKRFLSLLNI